MRRKSRLTYASFLQVDMICLLGKRGTSIMLLLAFAASFGFQNVELGITEAQLRAAVPSLACSGEIRYLEVTPDQAAAGTRECTPTEVIGGSRVAKWASVGDYSGSLRYYVTQGVVARIEFWPDYPAAEAILAGLTQKYGAPKELKRGVSEAVSGVQVPSLTAVWRQGDQTIELRSPSSNIGKMTVTYSNGIPTERVVPAKM